ncbi:hypothetical protein OWV82_024453 [Melia azedarach]|uniref:Uncharacterized protein n=1 Tax=Melia azedarach TaxID=155640 RepID=A0ACC1WQN8_MELAZ|nr:hypothetical protein OWV82_024453 [Melia azedarach]
MAASSSGNNFTSPPTSYSNNDTKPFEFSDLDTPPRIPITADQYKLCCEALASFKDKLWISALRTIEKYTTCEKCENKASLSSALFLLANLPNKPRTDLPPSHYGHKNNSFVFSPTSRPEFSTLPPSLISPPPHLLQPLQSAELRHGRTTKTPLNLRYTIERTFLRRAGARNEGVDGRDGRSGGHLRDKDCSKKGKPVRLEEFEWEESDVHDQWCNPVTG